MEGLSFQDIIVYIVMGLVWLLLRGFSDKKGEGDEALPSPPLPAKKTHAVTIEKKQKVPPVHNSEKLRREVIEASLKPFKAKDPFIYPSLDIRCEKPSQGDRLYRSPPHIYEVFKRLKHLPDLVIYQEILSKPKALRNHDESTF